MAREPISEAALTPRQRQVMNLIVGGRTNGEIAEKLGISLDGAKWHVTELLNRFGVQSREELIEAWAARERGSIRWVRAIATGVAGIGVPKAGVVAGGLAVTALAAGALTMGGSGTPPSPNAAADATATAAQAGWFIELALRDVLHRDDANVMGGIIPALPSDVVDSNAAQRPMHYTISNGRLVTLVFTGPMPEGDFYLWLDPYLRLSTFDQSGFYSGARADSADRWYVRFRVPTTALGETVRLELEPAAEPTPTPVRP